MFFLSLFKLIFEKTDVAFQVLQNMNTDTSINYFRERLNSLLTNLENVRTSEECFESLYKKIFSNENSEQHSKKRKVTFNLESKKMHCKQIYNEVCDTVINQIRIRFDDLDVLQIFDLVNKKHFSKFHQEFPAVLFNKLLENYKMFDRVTLKNELSILYSDLTLLGESKTLPEMLKFIQANNLEIHLNQIDKLIRSILTIPTASVSVERSFSALKRIKTFTRNTMSQDRLSKISILAIEKLLLNDMKQKDSFYQEVIDHFANEKNRRIPLFFKKY